MVLDGISVLMSFELLQVGNDTVDGTGYWTTKRQPGNGEKLKLL